MARSTRKRRVGSLGDMACFSFYPGKNLGAYGEAGMVTTDNPGYTKQIGMLRDWGAEQKVSSRAQAAITSAWKVSRALSCV